MEGMSPEEVAVVEAYEGLTALERERRRVFLDALAATLPPAVSAVTQHGTERSTT